MKYAIQDFKDNKPTWDNIWAIMIDKDFGEMSRQHECSNAILRISRNTCVGISVGRLNQILKPETERVECVETLYFLQCTAELEYASKFNVIGSWYYHSADEMLQRLSMLVCPHAFNLIRKEYELFSGDAISCGGRRLQDQTIVQLKSSVSEKEYVVNVSMNKQRVILINYIHQCWTVQCEINHPESYNGIACSSFQTQYVKTKTKMISFAVKAVVKLNISKGIPRTDANKLGTETNQLETETNQVEASQDRLVVRKRTGPSNNR
ncbi:unnamed protein product [Phytophthora fragariaefolia]|uniref:Unnamed protein product n=1 Tax=Phytophthora fragariaefolia TaxID=1490495 RepID=A0A9W6TWS2_9STRA|nr:unnamed protein product [Phytophthora fragariaefolia]